MKNGMALATAVLGLFGTTGCASDGDDSQKKDQELVHCFGINECAGKSECASADGANSCEGMNDCMGHGWISVTAEECEEEGGMILEES